jgi:multicomponent Na+:H+ antiporter subunit D
MLILPVLIPLITGAVLVLLRPPKKFARKLSGFAVTLIMTSVIYLGIRLSSEGVMMLRFGDWQPPFGIVFAIDWLSVLMLFFLNLIGFCVVIYSFYKSKRGDDESAYYYSLLMFQIAGVNGALSTGDIFNLFVWYEVMLISSYCLFAQGGYRDKLKGVPDYIVINMTSSALFLVAIGITYLSYGTLNMAHLGQLTQAGHVPPWATTLAVLFFVVFGTKAAVFPLYFWLFRGYPLATTPVAALFGGLLTKVGIYSMLRVFPLMFPGEFASEASFVRVLFYLVGAASILFGVFGALSRHEWKDILSHHITSQIGYMIVGIGLWSTAALAGTLFYVVQHTVVKSGLFLIGGMTEDFTGTTVLEEQGGLLYNIPFVGALFMTGGLALAGLPPLSGFFAKMTIFYSAFELAYGWAYFVVAIGLIGGLFTLYSMVKIWRIGFLGEIDESRDGSIAKGLFIGPCILVVTSILLGIFGGTVMQYTRKASHQLMNPDEYIETVMDESPLDDVAPGEYTPEPASAGHSSGHSSAH